MNPGSIGWAYVDQDGNLKSHGKIPLQMGLPSGNQDAQIVDACLQLVNLATLYACPVVCEELDFSKRKLSYERKVGSMPGCSQGGRTADSMSCLIQP